MSKLSKLIYNPNLFFRDFLLKKYPVDLIKIENSLKSRVEIGKCKFPIDVIYTWVDSDNSEFKKQLNHYKGEIANNDNHHSSKSDARWKNHDELKYSLRSLAQHAPWVNKIYIVTNGQIPNWLNLSNNKIVLVTHNEIIPYEYLPTFNSHVIGSCLHRIPGLSEHYIYFNDDVFLLRSLDPEYFFTVGGDAFNFISENELDNGPISRYDIPTIKAAKNSRKLILDKFGYYFSRRMAHMFHPQIKSISEKSENVFYEFYNEMRRNKFRSDTDLLCCSYLHPYLGYLIGRVHFKKVSGWYLKIRERSALKKYEVIKNNILKKESRVVLCANDYIPTNFNFENYDVEFLKFIEEIYPSPSDFELPECKNNKISNNILSKAA